MFIFTFDVESMQIVNEVSVKQDDGFRILNRLVLVMDSFPQQGSNDDELYLVAYDQGHTVQKETRMSNHARVFFNVGSGKLEFDTIVKVSMTGEEYDIIYDMYPFNETLILSGRIKGVSSIVTLAQCQLDLTKKLIACNPKYKPTAIVSGTVQINRHQMTYNTLDIETKEIKYYQLVGKFSEKTWNTKLMGSMKVDMPDIEENHYWIRGIHGSQWGGVIYYGSVTHIDPGVTFIDWSQKASFYDKGKVASIYDRDWIILGEYQGSQAMTLVRDETIFLIEAGFYEGHNEIYLTAKDSDGSVSTTARLTVLDSLFENIRIRNNIGNLEL